MLVVPFGRREVLGVVVGLSGSTDVAEEKLLAPLRALELGVPRDLVALAEWIAAEYCSTVPRALGLVLPPGRRAAPERPRAAAVPRPTHLSVGARSPTAPELTAQQRAALEPLTEALAAGRHEQRLLHGVTGLGQDRGVSAGRRGRAGAGARGDHPRAGDRAHAPDRGPLHRTLRRDGGGAALAAAPRRALRGVAPAARGRGPRLRGAALGGVRADHGPRPDRRRRGARLLLQARVRPAL